MIENKQPYCDMCKRQMVAEAVNPEGDEPWPWKRAAAHCCNSCHERLIDEAWDEFDPCGQCETKPCERGRDCWYQPCIGLPPSARRTRKHDPDRDPTAFYGDSFGDPSGPNEMLTFSIYGIQTCSANNNIKPGIDKVKEFLIINPITNKPRIFIHSRCVHLIEELRKYRWEPTVKTTGTIHAVKTAKPLKKDDDTADALRYLIMSAEFGNDVKPSTASNRGTPRDDVPLERNRGERPIEAARQGFFRK